MAFAGWFWPIIKNMTQMAAAATTMYFGSDLKDEPSVLFCPNRIWEAFKKTRPAGFAVILGLCAIDRQVASAASVGAGARLFIQGAGVGVLGLFLAQYEVFVVAQTGAPLGFAAANLKVAGLGGQRLCKHGRASGQQECSTVHNITF